MVRARAAALAMLAALACGFSRPFVPSGPPFSVAFRPFRLPRGLPRWLRWRRSMCCRMAYRLAWRLGAFEGVRGASTGWPGCRFDGGEGMSDMQRDIELPQLSM